MAHVERQLRQRRLHRPAGGPAIRLLDRTREAHERLTAILKADRFDPGEYIAAAKATRLEHDNDREAADEELVRAIAQLSPDDRRKLAEIRRHPPRGGAGGLGPGFGGFH